MEKNQEWFYNRWILNKYFQFEFYQFLQTPIMALSLPPNVSQRLINFHYLLCKTRSSLTNGSRAVSSLVTTQNIVEPIANWYLSFWRDRTSSRNFDWYSRNIIGLKRQWNIWFCTKRAETTKPTCRSIM